MQISLTLGGGDSHFVVALLDKGYRNIYVLDISNKAIEKVKERLGSKASKVHWIVCDVTDLNHLFSLTFGMIEQHFIS